MPNDYSVYRRFLILNMINRFGPISRTGLIKLTDSRPASIGELTKELLDDKHLEKQVADGDNQSSGFNRYQGLIKFHLFLPPPGVIY